MNSIHDSELVANLPVPELEESLAEFLEPVVENLPDKRLREVCPLIVKGILAAQSPVVMQMARGVAREEESVRPIARRIYRFLWNSRFEHRDLRRGMYTIAKKRVDQEQVRYLLVAVDGVNLEKAYTEKLEGVCTVQKSTPPGPGGEKRLTSGFPAITAAVVNLPEPVITYASWYSYVTDDFISERREVYQSIHATRTLFPDTPLRFVGDSGLDDKKVFREVDRAKAEFIFRICHYNRRIEVYNERLDRWESERLDDLLPTLPLPLQMEVTFTHARKTRHAVISLGWLKIRLPDTKQVLWVLVAHDPDMEREIVLMTNVPIESRLDAQTVYTDWRYRPHIEHTYRFDQERGLDVEDMRVQTMERMRRLFVLVLLATLFVYFVDHTWPNNAVLWLRHLGGKLGFSWESDGPYVLLAGISAVFTTIAVLNYGAHHPFPRGDPTCG